MKKPELLVTARSMEEVSRLLDAGADAIHIGEETYGLRLPGSFDPDQIAEASRIAHARGAKVYAVVNNIMSNDMLSGLPAYFQRLHDAHVDAVVFGDPAVVMGMKQAAVSIPLHWNTEMTSTNYATANYWSQKGATRVVLARELNMEQVLEVKRQVSMEVQVQVHGMTNIYHSKRNLLKSYQEHSGKPAEMIDHGPNGKYVLVEEERKDEKYPVFEDKNGTHIMSSDDICMIENLPELIDAGIDSFKIEGLMKSTEYNETVVRCYREAIDAYMADPETYRFNEAWLERINSLQDPERELSYGFFYKEQVY